MRSIYRWSRNRRVPRKDEGGPLQPDAAQPFFLRAHRNSYVAAQVGLGLAIVVQAVVFSVAHPGYSSHLLDFGSAFVAGLILGWLRGRDSSLVTPCVAHGLFWMMGAFMALSA